MKISTTPYLFALLICTSAVIACKEGSPSRTQTYQLTYEITEHSIRNYPHINPDKDSIVTTVTTGTDVLEIANGKKDSLEIISWESGCNMPICCTLEMCAGAKFKLTDNRFASSWPGRYNYTSYDFSLTFSEDRSSLSAFFDWREREMLEVIDARPDTVLYFERTERVYRFTGFQ